MDLRVDELESELSLVKEEVRFLRAELARLLRVVEDNSSASKGAGIGGKSVAASLDGYSLIGGSSEAAPAASIVGLQEGPALGEITSWPEREALARQIGLWLQRCLRGENRGSSHRDRVPFANTVWIVLRDFEGHQYSPALVCHRFAECKRVVKRGTACGDSVFIGFASLREAKIAVAAAGVEWPESR